MTEGNQPSGEKLFWQVATAVGLIVLLSGPINLAFSTFGLEGQPDTSDSLDGEPRLTATEVKKDLGTVSLKNSTVTTEFAVKNSGSSDLIIDRISSSCGCTSASIVYKGEEGPRFYMAGHGNNAPDPAWEARIAPGDVAIVKVYYDPNVHPDLTGPVTREVKVFSNDPVNPGTKFTITLYQEK